MSKSDTPLGSSAPIKFGAPTFYDVYQRTDRGLIGHKARFEDRERAEELVEQLKTIYKDRVYEVVVA